MQLSAPCGNSIDSKFNQHDQVDSKSNLCATRAEAIANGDSRYFTGKPCHIGHVSERYVSNKQCCECNASKSKKREAMLCAANPSHRMYRSVQRRSGQCLTGRHSPREALGCSQRTLQEYVSRKFTVGMCWARYGQWELDHIIPLSRAESLAELIDLCHYKNLQPLWKRHNRMKGNK
jgi:hypothetical protein